MVAQERTAALETQIRQTGIAAQQGQRLLASRVEELEAALAKEQESSLKALQALLASAGSR